MPEHAFFSVKGKLAREAKSLPRSTLGCSNKQLKSNCRDVAASEGDCRDTDLVTQILQRMGKLAAVKSTT